MTRVRRRLIILRSTFAGSDVSDEVHSTVELLLRYLHGTVMADLSHINRLVRIERNSFMNLDVTAIRNLELVAI